MERPPIEQERRPRELPSQRRQQSQPASSTAYERRGSAKNRHRLRSESDPLGGRVNAIRAAAELIRSRSQQESAARSDTSPRVETPPLLRGPRAQSKRDVGSTR